MQKEIQCHDLNFISQIINIAFSIKGKRSTIFFVIEPTKLLIDDDFQLIFLKTSIHLHYYRHQKRSISTQFLSVLVPVSNLVHAQPILLVGLKDPTNLLQIHICHIKLGNKTSARYFKRPLLPMVNFLKRRIQSSLNAQDLRTYNELCHNRDKFTV